MAKIIIRKNANEYFELLEVHIDAGSNQIYAQFDRVVTNDDGSEILERKQIEGGLGRDELKQWTNTEKQNARAFLVFLANKMKGAIKYNVEGQDRTIEGTTES